MALSFSTNRRLLCSLSFLLLTCLFSALAEASPSCSSSPPAFSYDDHHHHDHGHDDHADHHHHHHSHNHDRDHGQIRIRKLPEELAEEEDLALDGSGFEHHSDHHHHDDHHHHHHHHHHLLQSDNDYEHELSPLGIWIRAMGCSLLVSMASLICLIILPLIFVNGKPSGAVVDCLAVFGAGAMLGDAFLHQLPHSFGGKHSHSRDDQTGSFDNTDFEHGHSHAHSLADLSVGLSVLFGIVLFFLVEKIVRYVEGHSENGSNDLTHGHHHDRQHKLKHDGKDTYESLSSSESLEHLDVTPERQLNDQSDERPKIDKHDKHEKLRKRTSDAITDGKDIDGRAFQDIQKKPSLHETVSVHPPSNLVFGYLNLFSDGVHNFTDGMALGSAFLLHGPVGGWSRTLFLLAHELPQEVGDFGILVRSGFSVSKALFFNFLSALVALSGTALALVLGKDPGQSSLIEGFTAGGFIYIAVAGVLPEMHHQKPTLRSTIIQLIFFLSGMSVALYISLVE